MSEQNKHYLKNREDEPSPKQKVAIAGVAGLLAAGAVLAVHDRLNDVEDQRRPEDTTTTSVEVTDQSDAAEHIDVYVDHEGQPLSQEEIAQSQEEHGIVRVDENR